MDELLHDLSVRGIGWSICSTDRGVCAELTYKGKTVAKSYARLAQWAAKGRIQPGETFVHESIIGSLFKARVEGETTVGGFPAIIPSIEGWAVMTGLNTIFVDDHDPFRHGFVLADRQQD